MFIIVKYFASAFCGLFVGYFLFSEPNSQQETPAVHSQVLQDHSPVADNLLSIPVSSDTPLRLSHLPPSPKNNESLPAACTCPAVAEVAQPQDDFDNDDVPLGELELAQLDEGIREQIPEEFRKFFKGVSPKVSEAARENNARRRRELLDFLNESNESEWSILTRHSLNIASADDLLQESIAVNQILCAETGCYVFAKHYTQSGWNDFDKVITDMGIAKGFRGSRSITRKTDYGSIGILTLKRKPEEIAQQ